MAANLKGGYGRSKGRPPNLPPIPKGPVCETCRRLCTSSRGNLKCSAGRILDPVNCPDYRSAAVDRVSVGGLTGRIAQP